VLAAAALVVTLVVVLVIQARRGPSPANGARGARPSRVAGFDQIAFSVRAADGKASRHCALLALTAAQQNQGLMNRQDLAGYDGMLFEFSQPTTVPFYMKDTVINLSIAWFDAAGRYVSATDMPPCGSAAVCPLFYSAAPYTVAIEVAQGQLARIGVTPGSTLSIGGSC
jgi:uncharacterized membrane protein (UPF0127 family)